MTETTPVPAIPIIWYDRDDYERARSLMLDRSYMHPSFDAWRAGAVSIKDQLIVSGRQVVRAHLRSDIFATWCSNNKLEPDLHARNRWGDLAVQREQQRRRQAEAITIAKLAGNRTSI